jgi:dihydroorotate dehydrogenase (fumarate)
MVRTMAAKDGNNNNNNNNNKMVFEVEVDLSTSLASGRISLSSCLYNASGPRSGTVAALQKVAANKNTGAVLSKSATLLAQTGNPLPRTHHDDDDGDDGNDSGGGGGGPGSSCSASFNSEGLPNSGIDYYINADNIQEILLLQQQQNNSNDPSSQQAEKSTKKKKPYFVSLSGKTVTDNMEMLQRILDANEKHSHSHSQQQQQQQQQQQDLLIASVELNLACPNIIGKPIIGYDVAQVEDALRQVDQVYKKNKKKQSAQELSSTSSSSSSLPVLGIKLPPYLDFVLLESVAHVLQRYAHVVSYIVCINTLGNAMAVNADAAQPYIRANSGYAGLSGGNAVHAIACSNVHKFYTLFHQNDTSSSSSSSSSNTNTNTSIDIIGCGGVTSGRHVANLLLCGARAVQVGTTHWREGPACFDRIATELCDWMQQEHVVHLYQHENKIANLIGAMHHRHKKVAEEEEEEEWSSQRASQARNIKKLQKIATTKSMKNRSPQQQQQQCTRSELNLYKFTTAFLIVVVAILVADKWNHPEHGSFSFLPTE